MHRRTVLKLPALFALPASPPRRLVAFGDSITAGVGTAHPYAAIVAARLGYVLDNRAVAGTRATDHAAAIAAYHWQPGDRALWLTGYNDMRAGVAPLDYAAALRDGLRACPVPLLLGNCLRMRDYTYPDPAWAQGSNEAVALYNGVIAAMAQVFKNVRLVNACAAYNPTGGVHPDDAGHWQIAGAFAPLVFVPMAAQTPRVSAGRVGVGC